MLSSLRKSHLSRINTYDCSLDFAGIGCTHIGTVLFSRLVSAVTGRYLGENNALCLGGVLSCVLPQGVVSGFSCLAGCVNYPIGVVGEEIKKQYWRYIDDSRSWYVVLGVFFFNKVYVPVLTDRIHYSSEVFEENTEQRKEWHADFLEGFLSGIVAPVTEELLYRGCLQIGCKEELMRGGVPYLQATTIAISVSSLLFGLAHEKSLNTERFTITLVLGVYLSIVRENKPLSNCIAAHALYNSFIFAKKIMIKRRRVR